MSNISLWSSTDENNNRVPPDGFPEHQSPSSVNNSARALMGGVRRAYLEQPYFNPGGVIEYVNTSTFQIRDTSEITDFTQFYTVGRRLKFISPNGVLYGNVGSVRYGGAVAEIKCYMDSGAVIDGQTSAVYCGLAREDTGEVVGRLPVGMILPYTAMSLPAGFLYADGGSFDPAIYTELARIWKTGDDTYLYGQEAVGGSYWPKTPDVRGQFPRYLDMGAGIDPDSDRVIGSEQTDAIRNITGEFARGGVNTASGVFAGSESFSGVGDRYQPNYMASFDASTVVPTAEENRPVNMAFPALIVAWHGITPAENISMQDLLNAFNQMQGTVDHIYEAKDVAVTELNNEITVITATATENIVSASQAVIAEVDAEIIAKSTEITNTADAQITRVGNAGSSVITTAQSWATGTIEERPEGSAEYWAEKAKENSGSAGGSGTNDHSVLTNRNLADQHTIGAITDLQATLDGKANTSLLSEVATSGAYADLTGLPNLSQYATTSALTSGLATKQNKLTAGDNITITGNTISASNNGTFPDYSAGISMANVPNLNSIWIVPYTGYYTAGVSIYSPDGIIFFAEKNQGPMIFRIPKGQQGGFFASAGDKIYYAASAGGTPSGIAMYYFPMKGQ